MQILCTLGPASLDAVTIRELDQKGVDLFRLNLSHTPIESLEETVRMVHGSTTKPLCLDTDGAQVRTGPVSENTFLTEGAKVRLTVENGVGNADRLTIRPATVFNSLEPGHLLSIDFDGALLRVIENQGDHAIAEVIEPGSVRSNKAVTIDPSPALPPLTDGDKAAIKIGRDLGVRHVALSFARRAQDIARLRNLAGADSYVISKIETRAGVRNMDGIIAASDAVIIDRGDLSREVPLAHVPMHQKEIIRRANAANTPVFVATNLLESMVANRRPTIAEANDIINTLLDGAHGLVLAAETTIGKYPVATVEMIAELIEAFEWSGERRLYQKGASLRSRKATSPAANKVGGLQASPKDSASGEVT